MVEQTPPDIDQQVDVDDPLFGEYYYRHDCGTPYERNEHWTRFFGGVADAIVRELRPRSVLDVGCAMGFLVEELRIRGVEAWGVDVSEYAIENVHSSVADYCAVSSAAVGRLPEGFPVSFDLVTCIEVIEHLDDDAVLPALVNLTKYSDRLLFSSSPEDYTEATHLNVKTPDQWSARLAGLGMWRNLDLDASFLTPWAVVYDRREPVPPDLVAGYERTFVIQQREIRALRADALRRHSEDVRASTEAEDHLRTDSERTIDSWIADADAAAARLAELEPELASARAEADAARAEADAARVEFERTADLLEQAQLATLAVRDHAIGAAAEAGQIRAHAKRLESELETACLKIEQGDPRVRGLLSQVEGMQAIVEHRDAILRSETWRIGAAITSPMRLIRPRRHSPPAL